MEKTLNGLFRASFESHWDLPSLADFGGEAFRYREVATIVMNYHATWRALGYEPGTKIAICGRNSAQWAIAFLAAVTYGAVPVPLLNEFAPSTIHHLVSHSDARFLLVGASVAAKIDAAAMPTLDAVVRLDSKREVLHTSSDIVASRMQEALAKFDRTYPDGVGRGDLRFHQHRPDDLCIISYTSGTTSDPKGVMIPERAVWSNMAFAKEVLPMLSAGQKVVSFLPTAHLYGMAYELLYEFCVGIEVTFINKVPSPQVILQALAEKRPHLIVVVPLLLEKIVQRGVMKQFNSPKMRAMRQIPLVRGYINRKFRDGLCKALGNLCGRRPTSCADPEVEELLKEIEFPFTVGYGMTECAPIIGYADWKEFVRTSCGKAAPRMEVRILSDDPAHVPGEIVTRGMNVMLGYYKNDEATRAAIDSDGWLHTGDMGVMDSVGNIFIRGRIKNMLLGPSGQNIYPEELEAEVNSLPYVSESVVVQRGAKLVALVYPDREAARIDHLAGDAAIAESITRHLPTAVCPPMRR